MAVEPSDLGLGWSGRLSLAARILVVNILPLTLLAGSFFYIDGFRARLIRERVTQTQNEAQLLASAIGPASEEMRAGLIRRPGDKDKVRLRLVSGQGQVVFDSWEDGQPSFKVDAVEEAKWQRRAARFLDAFIDAIVSADVPPAFPGFAATARMGQGEPLLSLMPDRSHIISVKEELPGDPSLSLVVDRNARDIRRLVRSERTTLGYAVGFTALLSVWLSLFLARTIAKPLRMLAAAAIAVRHGQAREVIVPRLPSRRDEIGVLGRAVSDMSHALRQRIDAIEAFAADVAHELKNPLASLSSAVEAMERVKSGPQRDQLMAIVTDDVRRMDRLITDISELSRVDARIGRTRFEAVDLGQLISALVKERAERLNDTTPIAYARPANGTVIIHGDAAQMGRVISNLLDNAVSFSPPGGTVRIAATRVGDTAQVTVDDDGPGVPPAQREAVFDRFHSSRPDDQFGQHSGLGLAIARRVVEAHGGDIRIEDGAEGAGARFVVAIPVNEGQSHGR